MRITRYTDTWLWFALVLILAMTTGIALGIVYSNNFPSPVFNTMPIKSIPITQGGRLQVVHRQYVVDGGGVYRSIMIVRDQETHAEYLVVEDAGVTPMVTK